MRTAELHAARPHLFSYPGNGGTDCAQIWFVVREPLAWSFTKKNGGTGAHVQLRPPPLPYLGNGWTDFAETWGVVRGPLTMRYTKDGGYPHERTCS